MPARPDSYSIHKGFSANRRRTCLIHPVYFLVPNTRFTSLLPFSVPTVTMTVRLLLSFSAESIPPEDVAVLPAKFAPIVNPASFRPFS